ncbi:MAG: DUF1801 domain-containing protein [Steroidobacteraceae bacterium]
MHKQPFDAAASPSEYLASLRGWQKKWVTTLRFTVRASAKLDERIKWGHLVYFSNGPVLLIRAEESRVLFGFWRGKRLLDIEPRLQGSGKYELRTLVLHEETPLSLGVVRRLTKAAVALNRKFGDPTKPSR